MQIRKAERKKAKLRLGISGSSGSGKTWSALEIATGMGGKVGIIDTESGRAELYANDFDYDVIRLDAPYSPERYIQAIKAFENAGYDILIIDSLSHAWVGEGGVLSIAERAGGQFQNGWRKATPAHNSLIDAIITSRLHIITTLRTKTEYVVEQNEKGKQAPRKVGLAPVQRDGLEYEFTVFMDINQDHIAHVTKDNTKLFDGQYIKPSKDMGEKLMEWLNTGIDDVMASTNKTAATVTEVDQDKLALHVDLIRYSETIEDLKENYKNAVKEFAGFPEVIKSINTTTNTRKAELEAPKTDNGEAA